MVKEGRYSTTRLRTLERRTDSFSSSWTRRQTSGTDGRDRGTDGRDRGTDGRDRGTDGRDRGTDGKDRGTDIRDRGTDGRDRQTQTLTHTRIRYTATSLLHRSLIIARKYYNLGPFSPILYIFISELNRPPHLCHTRWSSLPTRSTAVDAMT